MANNEYYIYMVYIVCVCVFVHMYLTHDLDVLIKRNTVVCIILYIFMANNEYYIVLVHMYIIHVCIVFTIQYLLPMMV